MPRLTLVSEGKPRRRLLVRSKAGMFFELFDIDDIFDGDTSVVRVGGQYYSTIIVVLNPLNGARKRVGRKTLDYFLLCRERHGPTRLCARFEGLRDFPRSLGARIAK